MDKGYVKLYRSIRDNELLANDKTAFYVFVNLLLLADRNTGTYRTGRKRLAALLRMNEKTLYSALKRLNESATLQQRSSNQSTTFYICNWELYQQPVSNASSSRHPAVSTKQEEEEEYIDTNVSIEKSRGKPEINELFEYWEKTVGYPVKSKVQANRNAANNLLKKYSVEQVKLLINGVNKAHNEQYAPQISDFTQLQSKLNDLFRWGKNKGVAQSDTAIID